ncbi:MAG: tetratricopeptide repeat protein [Pseudomonadota bacterium]
MKPFLLVLFLALAGPLVHAADTPTVAEPTATERLGLARDAIKAKDFRRAVAELNIAVREEPRNADIHNLLGYSLRKQARPDMARAIEHYKTAIKLDPRHKGAHEYIGEAYLMEKNPGEAEKHLAELARICGNTSCEEYADLSRSLVAYKAKAK